MMYDAFAQDCISSHKMLGIYFSRKHCRYLQFVCSAPSKDPTNTDLFSIGLSGMKNKNKPYFQSKYFHSRTFIQSVPYKTVSTYFRHWYVKFVLRIHNINMKYGKYIAVNSLKNTNNHDVQFVITGGTGSWRCGNFQRHDNIGTC